MMSQQSPSGSDADDSGNCSPLNYEDFDFDSIRPGELIRLSDVDEAALFATFSDAGIVNIASQGGQMGSMPSDLFVQTAIDSPESGYHSSISSNYLNSSYSDNYTSVSPDFTELNAFSPIVPPNAQTSNIPCLPVIEKQINIPSLEICHKTNAASLKSSPFSQSYTKQQSLSKSTAYNSGRKVKAIKPANVANLSNLQQERVYTAAELTKMRNREAAQISKQKQKNMVDNLLNEKEITIQSLQKQISEKDSLILLLQKQNSDVMLSLAQLQVKYNELLQKYEKDKNALQISRNIPTQDANVSIPVKRAPESQFKQLTSVPAKRTCLFAFLFIFLFNYGFYDNSQSQIGDTNSVTSRRLLESEPDSDMSDEGSYAGNTGYIYDPRLLFNRGKFRSGIDPQDVVKYDEITKLQSNTSLQQKCKDQMHSNSTHSYKVTRDLREGIKHYKKFTDKNSKFDQEDPTMKLQQMLYKTPNGFLMKSIYEFLNSWERKDDTVYMFAFGSNEWFLPKANSSFNASSTPPMRPKMSLLMPALNNSLEVNVPSRSHGNQGLYNTEFANSDRGLYLMQIDCLVMDTHLLPYENKRNGSGGSTKRKEKKRRT